jgi:hypothetical protein
MGHTYEQHAEGKYGHGASGAVYKEPGEVSVLSPTHQDKVTGIAACDGPEVEASRARDEGKGQGDFL